MVGSNKNKSVKDLYEVKWNGCNKPWNLNKVKKRKVKICSTNCNSDTNSCTKKNMSCKTKYVRCDLCRYPKNNCMCNKKCSSSSSSSRKCSKSSSSSPKRCKSSSSSSSSSSKRCRSSSSSSSSCSPFASKPCYSTIVSSSSSDGYNLCSDTSSSSSNCGIYKPQKYCKKKSSGCGKCGKSKCVCVSYPKNKFKTWHAVPNYLGSITSESDEEGTVQFEQNRNGRVITFQWLSFSGTINSSGIAAITFNQTFTNLPEYPMKFPVYIEYKGVGRITNLEIDPTAPSKMISIYLNTNESTTDIAANDSVAIYGSCVTWLSKC